MNPTAEQIFSEVRTAFADPKELLNLSVEELGSIILDVLVNKWPRSGFGETSQLYSFVYNLKDVYGGKFSKPIEHHVAEAWQFLLSENLIAICPDLNGSNGHCFVTSKGKDLASTEAMENYLKARALPVKSLHKKLQTKIHALFIRGDYDTAVFHAYKEVEVSVRNAAKLPPTDIGSTLMRKAFHVDNGSLTDQTLVAAERQAMQDLFAGSIGVFKNPQSHRHVGIISPEEAAEMILLANYLLRIIDGRLKTNNKGA